MNVGATNVTDYGNYYMYGMGSKTYDSTDTPYDGTENPLDLSKDTANVVWGGDWHMPTQAQLEELIANTTYEWTNINGVKGGKFTNKTDSSKYIFMPAAGNWNVDLQEDVGSCGYYWGSSPDGSALNFEDGSKNVSGWGSGFGFSVRGVVG